MFPESLSAAVFRDGSQLQFSRMSLVELDHLDNEDLRKRLVSLISIDDWPDECLKCGYPKVLHKELHRSAACTIE